MELHCCYNHLLASTVKVSQTTHVADLPKFSTVGSTKAVQPGVVNRDAVNRELIERGIVLLGGNADEAPEGLRTAAGMS
jgi:hypothetical protein